MYVYIFVYIRVYTMYIYINIYSYITVCAPREFHTIMSVNALHHLSKKRTAKLSKVGEMNPIQKSPCNSANTWMKLDQ